MSKKVYDQYTNTWTAAPMSAGLVTYITGATVSYANVTITGSWMPQSESTEDKLLRENGELSKQVKSLQEEVTGLREIIEA